MKNPEQETKETLPNQEKLFSPQEMAERAEKLIRSGKMPTLEALLDAVRTVREKTQIHIVRPPRSDNEER